MRNRIRLIGSGAVVAFALATALFNGATGAVATQGFAVIAGTGNTELGETTICWFSSNASCTIGDSALGSWTDVSATAIHARDDKAGGIGVAGDAAQGTGVSGRGGDGVYGEGTENGVHAVGGTFGVFAEGTDYGTYSRGPNYGVFGQSTNSTGVGVAASASTATGTGLSVTGKAKFSRSGITTIAAGASSKTITRAGVTTASMVLATSQQNSTVFVRSAVPASGSFTIRLSGVAPTGGLKVAYFILN